MKEKEELYKSPKVKVVEIKVRLVVCQSNTERPTDAIPGWEWNY